MDGVLLSPFDQFFTFSFIGFLWANFSVWDIFAGWLARLPDSLSLGAVSAKASRAFFAAGAIYALVSIFDSRLLLARVVLSNDYGPRAIDIFVWCVFAVFVLAPRFRWRLVPVVAFLYGFEELLWNTEFNLSHIGDPYLSYLSTPYWHGFFVLMLVLFIGGYLVARPKVRWSWVVVPALLAFALDLAAGMPVGATVSQMLSHPWWPYNYTWEFMWQMAYLGSAWGMLRP